MKKLLAGLFSQRAPARSEPPTATQPARLSDEAQARRDREAEEAAELAEMYRERQAAFESRVHATGFFWPGDRGNYGSENALAGTSWRQRLMDRLFRSGGLRGR